MIINRITRPRATIRSFPGHCPARDARRPTILPAGVATRAHPGRWSDYRHTLYNHALPLSSRHSCLAVDGKTAFMGASSGHVRGVNLLLLDGSVTLVTRDIDLKVWKEFARISPLASKSPELWLMARDHRTDVHESRTAIAGLTALLLRRADA